MRILADISSSHTPCQPFSGELTGSSLLGEMLAEFLRDDQTLRASSGPLPNPKETAAFICLLYSGTETILNSVIPFSGGNKLASLVERGSMLPK